MRKTNAILLAVATASFALSGCAALKGKKKTPTLGERIPILASESEVNADKTIGGVEVLLPNPTENDSWEQPGGSASKSMGQLALAASPAKRWSVSIDGGSNRQRLGAAPVIGDGMLFAVDVD